MAVNIAYGLDFVSAFMFGLSRSTNFLQDTASRDAWMELYQDSHPAKYLFWLQEHPRLVRVLKRLGISIVPKWYFEADVKFDNWASKLVDETEKALKAGLTEQTVQPGEMPVMYFHQKLSMSEELKLESTSYFTPSREQRRELASECLDHLGR